VVDKDRRGIVVHERERGDRSQERIDFGLFVRSNGSIDVGNKRIERLGLDRCGTQQQE